MYVVWARLLASCTFKQSYLLQDCNHHSPPVTLTEAPLTYDERSDAKKTITSATSKSKQLIIYIPKMTTVATTTSSDIQRNSCVQRIGSLKKLGTDCVKMGKINKYITTNQWLMFLLSFINSLLKYGTVLDSFKCCIKIDSALR